MKNLILLIFVFAFTADAYGYIPRLEMIMDRVGRNHGYGYYLVDQEVIFQAQPAPYIVKEQWLINTDGSFRLRVKGERQLEDKLDITIVYNGNRKYYVNSDGRKKSATVGSEFVDPLFFTSNSDKLTGYLRRFQIKLPNYTALERLVDKNTKAPINPGRSETLNLGRVNGVVAYAIGEPTPFGNNEKNPGVWIEQDHFNILKLRLPTQTEVIAEEYSRHSRGMYYPKVRRIQTPTETFQINLRQVRTASANSTNKSLLSHTSLDAKKYPHVKIKLPDVEIIKSFYQRFR